MTTITIPNATTVTDVINDDVIPELARSWRVHPNYPKDPLRRTAITVEEAGEAMREALDLTNPRTTDRTQLRRIRERLYKEAVQTAATAIKLLAAMRDEDNK
jgi:hypothetical protein